jgi:hypothetical protein
MASNNVLVHPALGKMHDDLMANLKGGGDGPYDGDMEARVNRLEGRMDAVNDRLSSIEVTLARMEGKLDAKIDYKWTLAAVFGICALILRSEIASILSTA